MTRFLLLTFVLVSACASEGPADDATDAFRLNGAACLEDFVPLLATADSARAVAAVDQLAKEAAEAAMEGTAAINTERAQAELARICAERAGQTLDEILSDGA